jgi:iron complex outermembrane receptor protein
MTIPFSGDRAITMKRLLLAGVACLPFAGLPLAAHAADAPDPATVGEVVVTARHRVENVQDVPAAVSVLGGEMLTNTNTTNINQLAELLPSVQFTAYNPRNSQINIRGLGSASNLANDGLEPGVGFYVDQVYYARPASATFDLIDINSVQVLRGPQGTLYGKNTTAGAVAVTTSAPTFDPEARVELTGGDYAYAQGKLSVSGPLFGDTVAGRLSASYTTRSGFYTNVATGDEVNNYRNLMLRGQLLIKPSDTFSVRLAGDFSQQNTNCCAQVLSEIVTPSNGANFVTISQHFGYTPVVEPFARRSNTNAEIFARQETGGASAVAEWDLPGMTITSVTAWRFWDWTPSNDIDASPLDLFRKGSTADDQDQYSQELRIASTGENTIDYVAGLYYFREDLKNQTITEYGAAAAYTYVSTAVPGAVLDGVRTVGDGKIKSTSYAAYGQATWHLTQRLNVTGGLRYTYDKKAGSFDQVASGGVPLVGIPLVFFTALRAGFAPNISYDAAGSDRKWSGQLGLAYDVSDDVMIYANAARGYKTGGVNLAALPPAVPKIIAPEQVDSVEAGLKTRLFDRRMTLNLALFQQTAKDYQANIYDPALVRLYLANVPEVRTRGLEFDMQARPVDQLSLYVSGALTEATYTDYPAAACGLENITLASCDLTGGQVAGVPKWAWSGGGEYRAPVALGELFVGLDYSYRSKIGSTGNSRYTELEGRGLVNARIGIRSADGGWAAYVWSKNLLDEEYLTTKVPIGNNGGLFSNVGDPRTVGATLRVDF